MTVLGIETSCDETAAAIYTHGKLRSNIISSQAVHRQFGGVVPELASRAHLQLLLPTIEVAFNESKTQKRYLDGIAVTYGPGLVGSILVGLNLAKAMALALNLPWVGINHIEGHIFANFVEDQGPKPPFIALVISGGHTQLVLVKNLGEYITLGKTRDDAAGEAFDKVARMLELGYPGGPIIDRVATQGNPQYIHFPRAYLEGSADFSFSGLKTAVLYYLKSLSRSELKAHLADIAASFQAAVAEVLIEKAIAAAQNKKIKRIALAGGVACNSYLRRKFAERAQQEDLDLFIPPSILCTDNAAMIARTGLFRLERGERSSFELSPDPSLRL